jgi:hypothetical protein
MSPYPPGGLRTPRYTVQIEEVLKGNPPKTILVLAGTRKARFPMSVGKTYVMFFYDWHYEINAYGNSGLLSERKSILKALRGLSTNNDEQAEVPRFQADIILSNQAQTVLQERRETFIAAAYFSGVPRPDSVFKASKLGDICLGQARIEIAGQGLAKFENVKIPKRLMDALESSDYRVNLSVFSGRKSGDRNLLDCTPIIDLISAIENKRHLIKCRLVGEKTWP